jgi:hypothetical protein
MPLLSSGISQHYTIHRTSARVHMLKYTNQSGLYLDNSKETLSVSQNLASCPSNPKSATVTIFQGPDVPIQLAASTRRETAVRIGPLPCSVFTPLQNISSLPQRPTFTCAPPLFYLNSKSHPLGHLHHSITFHRLPETQLLHTQWRPQELSTPR